MFFTAEGITGLGKFQPYESHYITRPGFRYFLPFLGMDLHDTPDALMFFLCGIEHLHPAFQGS